VWFLEIRCGDRGVELANDKTAVVGDLENLVTVLEQVKEAVAAKGLDKAIEAVLTKKQWIPGLMTKLVLGFRVVQKS